MGPFCSVSLFRLLLPLMCRPLMRCIKTAAKHATPIIKQRMCIVDTAEEKGMEPELPVSIETSTSAIGDIQADIFSERYVERNHHSGKKGRQCSNRIRPYGHRGQDDGP